MTFLFRAFKTHEAPRVNQAEVIHAGWSHRDPKGITLLEHLIQGIQSY